jgi:urease gamma subunit
MKQKFALIRDDAKKALIIKEYAELDKEILSLLCEETYAQQQIESAIALGKATLVAAIRTHNMYPPGTYAEKIADAIIELYRDGSNATAELFFDDRELFSKDADIVVLDEVEEEVEEPAVDVDDLLDADVEDDFDDGDKIVTNLKSSIQVADDEPVDIDDVT